VKYVELSPVRPYLVARAEEYAYSSAACHAGLCVEPLLSPDRPFPGPIKNWAEYLADGLTEEQEFALRMATYTGRPYGSADFITRLEAQTGRLLTPRKRGRKPKEVTEEVGATHDLFDQA
jgi:putative transposase